MAVFSRFCRRGHPGHRVRRSNVTHGLFRRDSDAANVMIVQMVERRARAWYLRIFSFESHLIFVANFPEGI